MHHFFKMAAIHIARAVEWRLRTVKPTSLEQQMLCIGGTNHDVIRKYHTWRFSCLLLATFFVWLDAAFTVVGLLEFIENAHYFNPFGISAFALEYVAELVLAAVVSVSLYLCVQNPHASVSVLGYGWIVSTVVPLFPLFIPLEYLVAKEVRGEYLTSTGGYSFPAKIAVVYGVYLIPVLLTIPAGVFGGAMRVRGLLRQGSLAGWCAVASSFLFFLASLATFVLLSQAPVDFTLIAGMALFIVAPFGVIVRRQAFTTRCLFDIDMHGLSTTMNTLGMIQLLGLVLMVVWMVRAAGQGPIEVLQFGCAYVARLLVVTLVCAGLVLDLVVSNATDMKVAFERNVMDQSLDMIDLFEEHSLVSSDSYAVGVPNSIVVSLAGVEARQNGNKVVEHNGSNWKPRRQKCRSTYLVRTSKARLPQEVQSVASSSSGSCWINTHCTKLSTPYRGTGAFHRGGVEPKHRLLLGNSTFAAETGAPDVEKDRAETLVECELESDRSDGSNLLSDLVVHNQSDIQELWQNRTDQPKAVLQRAQEDTSCIDLPVGYHVVQQCGVGGGRKEEKHYPENHPEESRYAPNSTHVNVGNPCDGRALLVDESQTMGTFDDDPVPDAVAIENVSSVESSTDSSSGISVGNGPDAPAFSCAKGACDPRTERGIDP